MNRYRFAAAALAALGLLAAACADGAPPDEGQGGDEAPAVGQAPEVETLAHCTFWSCSDGEDYPTQAVCRSACSDPASCSPFNICTR